MKKYAEYKDSGAKWIGDIPQDWNTCLLKYMFSIEKRIAGEEGHTVLSITQKGIKPKDMSSQGQFAQDYSHYQIVHYGDFAMNHMDLLTGWIDISDYEGVTSPDYRVFTNKNHEQYLSEYYKYLFQYCYSNKVFYGMGQGVAGFGRWRLPAEMFLNLRLPVPSIYEQKAIVEYLKRNVDIIDAMIDDARISIDEYKSLKTSIISEAVIQGLDNSVVMKDSGIKWIGDIPFDWQIKKAKQVLSYRSEKNHPQATVLSLYRDYGIVPKDSRDDNHNVTSLDTETYKYVRIGDLVINKMKAWQGSLAVSDFDGIVSPAYHVFSFVDESINKGYIHHLLRSAKYAQEYERLSTGMRIGQWDLSKEDFLNVPVVIPSTRQQIEISDYLNRKCERINGLVAEKESLIEDLELYKKSLIFETVTGKRKVV